MAQSSPHSMYATPDHDEGAREDFVREMMVHVSRDLTPGKRKLYDVVVKPKFEKSHGRAPVNRHEVRRAMEQEEFNQVWGALRRTTQELMFDSIGESVERLAGDLMNRAEGLTKPTNSRRQGSLALDPSLDIPRYQTAVDIHCKPGGYHSELTQEDLFAGAEYDRSYNLFAMGASGPLNDDMGRSVARYASRTFADLKPRRILEIGCTVGHSTLPYCDLFPNAEVYAIDVAAPCLRYAHARAESLGYAVHWSQQNGEHTNFPDGHFDLIVSHILFHETSNKALRNILAECHRLLSKGGAMVHFEAPQYEDMPDPYDHTLGDWSTHYNAEPFWGTLHDQNLRQLMQEAGFAKDTLFQHKFAPSVFLESSPKHRAVSRTPAYPVFGARKS
jgi:ubiquinone/menaquinone biosynthesis C-methylase UbiE